MNFQTAKKFMETYDLKFGKSKKYTGEINKDIINPFEIRPGNLIFISSLESLELKKNIPFREDYVAVLKHLLPTIKEGKLIEYVVSLGFCGELFNILFPVEKKEQSYVNWSHIDSILKERSIIEDSVLVKRIKSKLNNDHLEYRFMVQPNYEYGVCYFDKFRILPDFE